MSFQYIQDYYKVPAEVGRRVEVKGNPTKQGVIVGSRNQYIIIHLDGEKKPRGYFHPVDGITYLEMGKVPKMTRSQQRWQRYQSLRECFDNFAQFLAYEKDEKDARACGFSDAFEYRRWLATL